MNVLSGSAPKNSAPQNQAQQSLAQQSPNAAYQFAQKGAHKPSGSQGVAYHAGGQQQSPVTYQVQASSVAASPFGQPSSKAVAAGISVANQPLLRGTSISIAAGQQSGPG